MGPLNETRVYGPVCIVTNSPLEWFGLWFSNTYATISTDAVGEVSARYSCTLSSYFK